MGESKRKAAAEASSPEDVLGPTKAMLPDASRDMQGLLHFLDGLVGDRYIVTLFLAEKKPAVHGELPRFNYGSTGRSKDMIAVMKSMLIKRGEWAEQIDREADAMNEPAKGSA